VNVVSRYRGPRGRTTKKEWRIVDKGVNGRPFLWVNRAGSRYVMIDIFNVRPDHCYTVLALDREPYSAGAHRKVIGIGCAEGLSNWVAAYESARRIAVRYMKET
jgi:hypothetical protein